MAVAGPSQIPALAVQTHSDLPLAVVTTYVVVPLCTWIGSVVDRVARRSPSLDAHPAAIPPARQQAARTTRTAFDTDGA